MGTALENFRAAPVQQMELSGIELSYRTFGDGPAVLFLHGWPLSGVTYRHLIETLRPYFRCIVPDLPGAGSTPWAPQITDTIQGYVDLMRAFVDQLQLESFAIVGHDSGGGVARLLAAPLGTRVTALLLQNTETPGHIPFMVRLLKLTAASSVGTAALAQLMKIKQFRRSPLALGSVFVDRDYIDGEFYEACAKSLETDLAGHCAALARLNLGWTTSLPEVHAKIEAPIHLFWGEKDTEYFPLEQARAMASQFKRRGEFKVVPNGKLFVHEEAHEDLSRFALPLLQQAFVARPRSSDARHAPS